MLILFAAMAHISSSYLMVNLFSLSESLKLPEDVAGVGLSQYVVLVLIELGHANGTWKLCERLDHEYS